MYPATSLLSKTKTSSAFPANDIASGSTQTVQSRAIQQLAEIKKTFDQLAEELKSTKKEILEKSNLPAEKKKDLFEIKLKSKKIADSLENNKKALKINQRSSNKIRTEINKLDTRVRSMEKDLADFKDGERISNAPMFVARKNNSNTYCSEQANAYYREYESLLNLVLSYFQNIQDPTKAGIIIKNTLETALKQGDAKNYELSAKQLTFCLNERMVESFAKHRDDNIPKTYVYLILIFIPTILSVFGKKRTIQRSSKSVICLLADTLGSWMHFDIQGQLSSVFPKKPEKLYEILSGHTSEFLSATISGNFTPSFVSSDVKKTFSEPSVFIPLRFQIFVDEIKKLKKSYELNVQDETRPGKNQNFYAAELLATICNLVSDKAGKAKPEMVTAFEQLLLDTIKNNLSAEYQSIKDGFKNISQISQVILDDLSEENFLEKQNLEDTKNSAHEKLDRLSIKTNELARDINQKHEEQEILYHEKRRAQQQLSQSQMSLIEMDKKTREISEQENKLLTTFINSPDSPIYQLFSPFARTRLIEHHLTADKLALKNHALEYGASAKYYDIRYLADAVISVFQYLESCDADLLNITDAIVEHSGSVAEGYSIRDGRVLELDSFRSCFSAERSDQNARWTITHLYPRLSGLRL
ncbi:MAG: hypothetical protein ACK5NY_06610 [Burkholderiaceae bacterium]|jgi:hypothetical protein